MPNSLQYAAVTNGNNEYRHEYEASVISVGYAKDAEGRGRQVQGDIKGSIVSVVFIVLLWVCRLRSKSVYIYCDREQTYLFTVFTC